MIFISYRIADSNSQVARLEERLVSEFGREVVFRDLTRLPGSQNFPKALEEAVLGCRIFLAAIGPEWKKHQFQEGHPREFKHRLSDPEDWVRREISLALDSNKEIVPVRIEAAEVPSAEWLREFELERLAIKQGQLLRTNDIDADFKKLADVLCGLCAELAKARDVQQAAKSVLALAPPNP
ncbi:MAG: toll/interleukin-1 receptor domain-containing protein, partial [Planctomycetota bacterium]|nr:toll/interleukin-1 receptor domain-containing protein [Planctomycetota bacterium]